MKEYTDLISFMRDFQTEDDCRRFLCEQKWGDGYQCRRCGHECSVKGRTWYHKRCQRCHYDESCTAHTLFHKVKFSLVKAFVITYQLSTMKKGMATTEIARQFSIKQQTAWFFKRKVQQAMKSGGTQMLFDNVEIDETVIGGAEKGSPGRSYGKKKKVQVAIEVEYPTDPSEKPKIKNANAVVIDGYSSDDLKKGIEKMIDVQALVTTDGWKAYETAVGGRWHESFPSSSGENFELIHWHIFNLKNWIRGIHHHVSLKHLHCYLQEFHYKFNRRNRIQTCPCQLLKTMTKEPWLPYKRAIEG